MRNFKSTVSLVLQSAFVISLLGLGMARPAPAVERTGEILRELLQGVERDFETLEKETHGFAKRAESLTKQLEEKNKLISRTTDPAKKEALKADLVYLGAQLNDLDRKEVDAALNTITEVRGKLVRIREALQRGGIVPASGELPQMRQKMGKFLSNAAQLLDKWEKSASGKKGEFAALKATLLGTLSAWEAPTQNIVSSQDELNRTMRSLDITYSQLLNLGRAFEQERHYLLVRNHAAVANLILMRLNGGKVNVGSVADAAEGKRNALQRRMEILSGTDGGIAPSTEQGDASLGASGEAAFDRMKRGEFGWSKEGAR